jgi:type 1 glutamine amidotransferase
LEEVRGLEIYSNDVVAARRFANPADLEVAMLKFAASFFSVCVAVCVVCAGAQAAKPKNAFPKLRVLVITGGHDFERESFFTLFQGYDDIEYKEAVHPEANNMFAPDAIKNFDVIVLYDMNQQITEEQKRNFVSALRAGKGLVVIHHAIANYQDWPEYEKIIGGRYYLEPKVVNGVPKARSAYEHDVKLTVRIADSKHPIVQGLKDFEIEDEVYSLFDVSPSAKPLLTTDHPKSNKVIAWTHKYGKARVVYIQLGHGPSAYNNPNYRRLVANAVRWAASRPPK